MVNDIILRQLFTAFPDAVINSNLSFVACPKVSSGFSLENVTTREAVLCKLFEWLSRDAIKGEWYALERVNEKYRKYHLDGINDFCGTHFTKEDMELIYQVLGNGVRHQLTKAFVNSGFDLDLLEGSIR